MNFSVHEQEQISRIASNWRLTPATMATKLTRGKWIAAPWLRYASTRIASGIARGGARIIISAPPRHGKSELVAKWTSVWALENFPDRNVILTGYGADLVEESGRWVRDRIREYGNDTNVLNARIRGDVSKVSAFLTESNGYMFSVGLGGAITGRGAHILLIDDYIKEIKEALSQAHRDYLWNWFVTTAMTRLEPGASVIIIATRWHSDDLIGRILKLFPGRWENICLPAEALEGDLLGRAKGEPLFPERYDLQSLQDQHEILGSIFYHALYQQGPVDEILKFTDSEWLKVIDQLDSDDYKWARTWDLAATEDGGDYTCGTLEGYSKKTGKCIIANVIRKQLSVGDVEDLVRKTAVADGLDTTVCIEQEPGPSGKGLITHYQTTVLPEFKVVAVPAVKSKLIRAQPFLAAAEAGKVYMLDETIAPSVEEAKSPRWHEMFKKEFQSFPAGENDDQVDTAAAGFAFLSGKKIMSASWGRAKDTIRKQSSQKTRQAMFMVSSARAAPRSSVAFGRTRGQ